MRALFLFIVAMNGRFVDERGGTVILRGVNVAGDSKVPPFRPVEGGDFFNPLATSGMNAVRLLFTWEAYEPTSGSYDDSYLTYYTNAVRAAAARGIYVIVDFHQDAFSRFSLDGCGEGFPEWAIPPDVPRATPDNSAACADWGARMVGHSSLERTWDAFFADTHGARTRYLMMVARVAQAMASEPNVIGYDLLNEPGGDEATELLPLYEDAARAIRGAHASAILFVSPGALTSAGLDTDLPRPSFDNFAYAPHYYDLTINLLKSWGGYEPTEPVAQMQAKAAEWGVPLLLGEFGAPAGAAGALDYVDAMYRELDGKFASATQWVYTPGWTEAKKDGWNAEDFSIVDGEGRIRDNFHARAFVRRVAGVPTSIVSDGKSLRAEWTNDPAAGETEIFFPGDADISSDADLSCRRDRDLVRCQSSTAGARTVRVAPAQPNCGLTGIEVLPLLYLAIGRRKRKRSSAASCA